ncbi:MAG: hypothetical protein U0Q12_26435 [Vicinamibacterales bacterium]
MARGWESKAIESQQADSASAGARGHARAMTPEERDRDQRRQTLSLARERALSDLQRSCNPAHRAFLERSLAALDEQIAGLTP